MKPPPRIEPELYRTIRELMPIACVDTVIEHEGRVLLVKRKNPPARNQWWFPGGRLCKGETIAEAAVRKAKEEVGLTCQFRKIGGIEETYFEREEGMEFDVHTVNVTVDLQLAGPDQVVLDGDHIEARWIDHNSQTFHPSVRNILSLRGFDYR